MDSNKKQKLYHNSNQINNINSYNINSRKNKILEILKNATVSSDSYDSSQQPFFAPNPETELNITSTRNNENKNTEIRNTEIRNTEIRNTEIIDLSMLPKGVNRNIILLYQIFNEKNKEIYLNNWTIMSINKAMEFYNYYCENNQSTIFDIAHQYIGMGHIRVLSCDLKTHLLFVRPDGGSNGFDREHNFTNLIKNGPSSYKQFFFSDWFFNMKEF
jgi:hypothetical protein